MAIQVLGEDGLPLTHLTQWDANRKLTIKGLPTFEQQPTLHYWDRDRYRAIVVPTSKVFDNITAQIPNILLQSSDDVVFTVFGRKPGVGGEAKAVFIHNVPVYEAKKPQDYTWEENIQYVEFTDLIKEAAALLLSLQQIGDHIEMTVDGMTVSVTQLPEGQMPTVDKTINEDGTINIAFGIPKGDKGNPGEGGGVPESVIDDKDRIILQEAKAYTDSKTQEVFTAVITNEVGNLVCDMTASQIIDASRNGVVKAEYTDPKTNELRTYYYFKEMDDGRAAFNIAGYIKDGNPKQTLIYVDYAGNVTTETRTASIPTKVSELTNDESYEKALTIKAGNIPEITSIETLRTYFYNLRKTTQRKWQFEISPGTNQNMMDALGYPSGVTTEDKAFLYIEIPYSEAGGFEIRYRYQLRDKLGIWNRADYSTLGVTWRSTGWKDADLKTQNLEVNHPVGSWWLSDGPTSPASLFGGTWEKLVDRMLVGAGGKYSVGATGGKETHTLTIDEMPRHTHASAAEGGNPPDLTWAFSYKSVDRKNVFTDAVDNSSGIAYSGGDKPHNNMPPYYATYIWRRTA